MKRIAKLLGYISILAVLNIAGAAEVPRDLHKDWLSIYIEPFTVGLRYFDLKVCLYLAFLPSFYGVYLQGR